MIFITETLPSIRSDAETVETFHVSAITLSLANGHPAGGFLTVPVLFTGGGVDMHPALYVRVWSASSNVHPPPVGQQTLVAVS